MIFFYVIVLRKAFLMWEGKQMRYVFKLMLALDSIFLLLIVYLLKKEQWLPCLGAYSLIVYFIAPFILAGICLWLADFLSHDSIEGSLRNIELANDSYMPSYLGYFFVALSIPDESFLTAAVIFCMLLVFILCSQNLYYNPLFLLFGYHFYYVTNQEGMKIFIISKRTIKSTKGLSFSNLRRINYFTFLDKETK